MRFFNKRFNYSYCEWLWNITCANGGFIIASIEVLINSVTSLKSLKVELKFRVTDEWPTLQKRRDWSAQATYLRAHSLHKFQSFFVLHVLQYQPPCLQCRLIHVLPALFPVLCQHVWLPWFLARVSCTAAQQKWQRWLGAHQNTDVLLKIPAFFQVALQSNVIKKKPSLKELALSPPASLTLTDNPASRTYPSVRSSFMSLCWTCRWLGFSCADPTFLSGFSSKAWDGSRFLTGCKLFRTNEETWWAPLNTCHWRGGGGAIIFQPSPVSFLHRQSSLLHKVWWEAWTWRHDEGVTEHLLLLQWIESVETSLQVPGDHTNKPTSGWKNPEVVEVVSTGGVRPSMHVQAWCGSSFSTGWPAMLEDGLRSFGSRWVDKALCENPRGILASFKRFAYISKELFFK